MTLARRCDCGKQDGEEEGCCRRVIGHLGEEETRLHQGELIKRAQGGHRLITWRKGKKERCGRALWKTRVLWKSAERVLWKKTVLWNRAISLNYESALWKNAFVVFWDNSTIFFHSTPSAFYLSIIFLSLYSSTAFYLVMCHKVVQFELFQL